MAANDPPMVTTFSILQHEECGAETLAELHTRIDKCLVCRSHGEQLEKVRGIQRGTVSAEVMLVGLAPSKAASGSGLAFKGNSFSRLRGWFALAGYDYPEGELRKALYLTSIIKCIPNRDNATTRSRLWHRCQEWLWGQIEIIRPRLILMLGLETVTAILGKPSRGLSGLLAKRMLTNELFDGSLFPPTNVLTTWLVLPHPSGRSRTMNDPKTATLVISALRAELDRLEYDPTGRRGG